MKKERDFSIQPIGKLRVIRLHEDFVARLLRAHPVAAHLFLSELIDSLKMLTGMNHVLEPAQRVQLEGDIEIQMARIRESAEAGVAIKRMSDGMRMLECDNEKFLDALDDACERI